MFSDKLAVIKRSRIKTCAVRQNGDLERKTTEETTSVICAKQS